MKEKTLLKEAKSEPAKGSYYEKGDKENNQQGNSEHNDDRHHKNDCDN